jgi:thiamine-phosphate pyrophosphorylase
MTATSSGVLLVDKIQTSLRRHYPVQVQTVGELGCPPSQPGLVGLPLPPILARHSCQTEVVDDRRQRLQDARLYLVCDDRGDEFVRAALAGGVDIVQLRMKDRSDAQILAAGRRLARACRRHGALFILNDRPDLVSAVAADGVHVGQDDLSPVEAREIVGGEHLVGLSTHSPEQIDAAAGAPVDYIGVGPVHATPTKPGRPAVGHDLVRYAATAAPVPFFAIGGISPVNAADVRAAGASRIAVVRALTGAADPRSTAAHLRRLIGDDSRAEAAVGSP